MKLNEEQIAEVLALCDEDEVEDATAACNDFDLPKEKVTEIHEAIIAKHREIAIDEMAEEGSDGTYTGEAYDTAYQNAVDKFNTEWEENKLERFIKVYCEERNQLNPNNPPMDRRAFFEEHGVDPDSEELDEDEENVIFDLYWENEKFPFLEADFISSSL